MIQDHLPERSHARVAPGCAQGFTLIELMIVVTLIGVLAAIAITQYQDYLTRSRWSDVHQTIGPIKTALAECSQNNNGMVSTCNTNPTLVSDGWMTALPDATVGGKYPGMTVTVGGGATQPTVLVDSNGLVTLGGCSVTWTGNISSGVVGWNATTGSAGCSRRITGVGT